MVASLPFRPSRLVSRIGLIVAAVLAAGWLLVLLPVSAATAGARHCRFAGTRIRHARRRHLQEAVVCLINQQRLARGLPALRASTRLNRAAQGWTEVMVNYDFFSHGSDFGARITNAGVNWSNAGENIATGYATPRSVVNAWMRSTGHCQNILDPLFREVGTGVANGRIRGFSSRRGTWTQDFVLQRGKAPASGNWGPAEGCPYG